MKVVDLNLLLYAVNRDSAHHEQARQWLEGALSGPETVGLPWIVIVGFLRLSTSARVFPEPLTPEAALGVVSGWLERPVVVPVVPGDGHWTILSALIGEAGAAGNLTTDAHLAALAMERGAELCSTDADFARFRGLRWSNPLGGKP